VDVRKPGGVHPPRRTNRAYRLGGDELLVDESGGSEVGADDYAIAIADLLEQGARPGSRVSVAW
jgi:uncharacterized protein